MNFKKFQKISIGLLTIAIFIFLFSIFYFSHIAKAAVVCDDPYSPYYDPAQCGSNISVSCSSQYKYPWCQTGTQDPAGLVSNFYKIALGLAAAAAMGVLIYGAILWTVSGAISSKKDAMDWIWGAIWGLILLLAAYVILYTINPNLVNLTNPNIPALSPPLAAAPSTPLPVGDLLLQSHQAAFNALQSAGITVTSSGGCFGQDAIGCTTLEGIPKYAIDDLAKLKLLSGADIIVTGGTETAGHTNHGPGKAVVDLGLNPKLDSYIVSNAVSQSQSKEGTVYLMRDNTVFLRESNHWHAVFVRI